MKGMPHHAPSFDLKEIRDALDVVSAGVRTLHDRHPCLVCADWRAVADYFRKATFAQSKGGVCALLLVLAEKAGRDGTWQCDRKPSLHRARA